MKNIFSKIIIFIVWFIPIIGAASYDRVDHQLINFTISISIIFGLSFLLFISRKLGANKHALFIALFIYVCALFSNFNQYTEILFFLSYVLLVHLIGYNFPKLLCKQYFGVCYLIVVLTIIDMIWFYIFGMPIIGRPEIGAVNAFLPRISGFFDEPTHQAIFLGPALFYLLYNRFLVKKKRKRNNVISEILILTAYLLTFSLTAYFMLLMFILYFLLVNRRMSIVGLLLISLVIFGSVFTVDLRKMFTCKLRSAYDRSMYVGYSKSIGGAHFIALADIVTNTRPFDLLVGVGYYNVYTLLPTYLVGSDLEAYYESVGYFDENSFSTNGIAHMFYAYGVGGIILIFYLLVRSLNRSRDRNLSVAILLTIILSMLKMPNIIGYSVYIFFGFGLFWSRGFLSDECLDNCSDKMILNKQAGNSG